jgi:hypothetical protein
VEGAPLADSRNHKPQTNYSITLMRVTNVLVEEKVMGPTYRFVDNNRDHFPNADHPHAVRGQWPPAK